MMLLARAHSNNVSEPIGENCDAVVVAAVVVVALRRRCVIAAVVAVALKRRCVIAPDECLEAR